jgi:hypothetical protein
VGASTTIGSPLDGNHNGRIYGGRQTGLAATGEDDTVADQKAAVIGRSKCTVARKLEWGTTPARGHSVQEWRANAAPLSDIPLLAADELPPPLLDGGQGKISSTTGVDSGERETEDRLQTTMASDGDRVDKVRTRDEDMTAIRDRIRSSDTSRTLNCVDLPRSETTPTPSSVVPPLGEKMTVIHGDTTVNGVHPPLERSSARARKGVQWRDPIHCSADNATTTTHGRSATLDGIQPPILFATGHLVTGAETDKLRLQNKRRCHALQDTQAPETFWTTHTGTAALPPQDIRPTTYHNEMCPAGIATTHPAGAVLTEWSQMGCPTRTGKPWTKAEMWEAVERGPHQSSLSPEAIAHFAE